METRQLAHSDLQVTPVCLGTMTFGQQNDQASAHQQLDYARERGINFIDTAEMYPVNPISAETVGLSEQIIGNWIAKTGRRDEVVIVERVKDMDVDGVIASLCFPSLPGFGGTKLNALEDRPHKGVYPF